MDILVGYTGLVGSNLSLKHRFDYQFNSKNISEAFGLKPDLLIYAGVSGVKYMANKFPEKDMENINNAIKNIQNIQPRKLVLISTIDVFVKPDKEDELSCLSADVDFVYGYHRVQLEKWVVENINDYLIVRLPGIYGENLKKNFIYDLIDEIPQSLNEQMFQKLNTLNGELSDFYTLADDGFYHPEQIENKKMKRLRDILKDLNFSALNFTDTRGVFQYYNLSDLWNHIQIALDNNLSVLNIATEPFCISELFNFVTGGNFDNELKGVVPYYNFKTKYDYLFGGKNGYIYDKSKVMIDIKEFVERRKKELI